LANGADANAAFQAFGDAADQMAEGGWATTVSSLDVTVTGVADHPTVTINDAAGAEDSVIPLDIGVALNDIDGSETITDITISGVPTGAELSTGTDNGDGTWTLIPADLAGLTVTPAPDSDADFTLSVSAISTETEGGSAITVSSLDVTVTGVADEPSVWVSAWRLTTSEDTAIPLDIAVALADTDGSESITDITISGVPAGANLSAGNDNGDGTWTLTPADLAGLTITPPLDFHDDFTLSVSATSTEAEGDTAISIDDLNVTVRPDHPTEGADVIHGTAGADTIDGLAGNDQIFGESGSDNLTGGAGNDFVSGGEGNDTLNYSVDGEWNNQYAAQDAETVSLNDMNLSQDVFDGGEGNDVLRLTDGDDAIFLDDRYSVFPDGAGPRVVGIETIDAGAGDDLVDLTSLDYDYGDVTINGGTGNDVIWSSSGNDILRGEWGDDQVFGGAGNDILWGDDGADVLWGGVGNDDLRANKGEDVLYGGAGDDILRAGKGDDVLFAGTGDDILRGGQGDDVLWGDVGNDDLRGHTGNDVLIGGAGNDTLDGYDGIDTADFSADTAGVLVDLATGQAISTDSGTDMLQNIENVTGGAGDDMITGSNKANVLEGGAGDDTIFGGGGADTIIGGSGEDILYGGSGGDTFLYQQASDGGDTIKDFESGTDTLAFSASAFVVNYDEETGAIDSNEFEVYADFNASAGSSESAFVFDSNTGDLYYDQGETAEGYTLVANMGDSGINVDDFKIM